VSAIKLAVKHYGSQKEMAYALGVTQSQVSQWCTKGYMSARRALQVESDTQGWIRALSLVEQTETKKEG
jgi:DNA-binding transcriptional regulator YdaS (Cro superfamily)